MTTSSPPTTQTRVEAAPATRTEQRPGVSWGDVLQLLALMLILLAIIGPFVFMVSTSFKTQAETFAIPPKIIFTPSLEHYRALFEAGNVPLAGLNSLIIALGTTVLAVLLGTPAAYVMARFEFPGKRDMWFWFISHRFISPIVVVLPFFLIADRIGDLEIGLEAIDSYWYLILVYQTFSVPLVIWLCLDQFRAIPQDVDDAAKVDGCNLAQTFFFINLPLALPGIVVSSILTFIFAWNEMLFALLLTKDPTGARTAPVEATLFMTGMGVRWGEMMATGTLIVLPVVIFAALVSRHLVRGLTMGAVK